MSRKGISWTGEKPDFLKNLLGKGQEIDISDKRASLEEADNDDREDQPTIVNPEILETKPADHNRKLRKSNIVMVNGVRKKIQKPIANTKNNAILKKNLLSFDDQ